MKRKTIQVKHVDTIEVLRCIYSAWATGTSRRSALETTFAHIPLKVLDRKLEHMCDADLIEYGVTLWQPWPTAKGLALLGDTPLPAPTAVLDLGPAVPWDTPAKSIPLADLQAFRRWQEDAQRVIDTLRGQDVVLTYTEEDTDDARV